MYNYDGIKGEDIWLLSQNRFENNKEFYEAHKEQIKKGIMIPTKQLASIFGEEMFNVDPQMELNPSKMVSRIRRDTRFSGDKSMYRENVWIMFMRSKKINPFVPCFWFEFFPGCYTCGVGTFENAPKVMEFYRKEIELHPKKFRNAIKSCEEAGAILGGSSYKKLKEGNVPKDLIPYYNLKNIHYMKTFPTVEDLANDEFIDNVKEVYKAMTPLYEFLLEVYKKYNQDREEQIALSLF